MPTPSTPVPSPPYVSSAGEVDTHWPNHKFNDSNERNTVINWIGQFAVITGSGTYAANVATLQAKGDDYVLSTFKVSIPLAVKWNASGNLGSPDIPFNPTLNGGVVGAAGNAASGALDGITSAVDFIKSPAVWLRIGEFAVGLVLLSVGVKAVTGINPVGAVTKTAAIGRKISPIPGR